MTSLNSITRKGTSILLTLALITTGLFSSPKEAYAERAVLSDQVYYHLDMGIQLAYEGPNWADRGYNPGDTVMPSPTVTFGQKVEVIDAYPLSSSKGSRFEFDGSYSSSNIPAGLKTKAGNYAAAYEFFYKPYVTTTMSGKGASSDNGNEITFSYSAKLNTMTPLEVVSHGYQWRDSKIWELFGSKNEIADTKVKAAIEIALEQGRNGTAGDNRLYLIFCPTVIEYKKYVSVGDLEAALTLPATAKQGDTYTAADASMIDRALTVDNAVLEKSASGGDWQEVVIWQGTGAAGKNTGGTVDESSSEICDITYRLTVATVDGQTDTDVKTINITDGREINGIADLILPEYTYEGHPALAMDQSTFTVDGEGYSATRAYKENIASNRFETVPMSAGKTAVLTDTTAEMTFAKKGHYSGKLTVGLKTGGRLTDTEPIEVRKTPYIIDNLSGTQKQNRKQVLTLSVATYPDKPIVDYYITLRDKSTGESIKLTQSQPKENSAAIKTRTVSTSGNKYWTTFRLEFLTKTPEYDKENPEAAKVFEYSVYVKDSKDDTDSVTKTFEVRPDCPPNPVIAMQEEFIRGEGSNTADIITEDASTTDGDQLERTWSAAFRNPATDAGEGAFRLITGEPDFKDLSFGSGQRLQFSKTGVGKVDVKLHLKDVWNEPTLPEYITEADYLTAETIKTAAVTNIKPAASIEPVSFESLEIALLVDRTSKAAIDGKLNTIRAALLENGIDGNISVAPIGESYDGEPKLLMEKSWPAANWCSCGNCKSAGILDSEYTFIARRAEIHMESSGNSDACRGPLTLYAFKGNIDTAEAETAWSYTGGENEVFTISEDRSEKYIFLHKQDETILLNRNNGAYVTTINLALPHSPFLSGDGERMYFVESGRIMRYDAADGSYGRALNQGGSFAQLAGGQIIFVGNESEYKYYIGRFHMDTEELTRTSLPKFSVPGEPSYAVALPPTVVDMDPGGKLLITAAFKDNYYSELKAYYLIYIDKESGTVISERFGGDIYPNIGFVRDETGEPVGIYRLDRYGYDDDNYAKIVRNLYYRDMNPDGSPGTERLLSSEMGTLSGNGIIYAGKHTKENKIYIVQGAGTGYTNNGYFPYVTNGMTAIIDLDTGVCDVTHSSAAFGGMSENETGTQVNGNVMASNYQIGQIYGGRISIKQIRVNLSRAGAEAMAYGKYVENKVDDVVEYIRDGLLDIDALVEKAKDKLASETSVKVTVNGGTGTISKDLALEPGREYYCEYAVKHLSSTGCGVSVGQTGEGTRIIMEEDKFTVVREHFEDFSSAQDVDPYFIYSDKSKIGKGIYSENITRRLGNNASAYDTAQSSTITFVVPQGERAVLSFDYNINLATSWHPINLGYMENGILIDGERFQRTMAGGSGHYTHPVLLEAGTHVITVFSRCLASTIYNHSASLDNLSAAFVRDRDQVTAFYGMDGKIHEYVAAEDGKYSFELLGPSSNALGGIIRAKAKLSAGDVLTVYTGPQAAMSTGARNGAAGIDGNGYGNQGEHMTSIDLNGKTILIAGGAGGDGQPGSGDGSMYRDASQGAEWYYRCWMCGRYGYRCSNHGTNWVRRVYEDCGTCGGELSTSHTHRYYHGTGGVGGKGGDGGGEGVKSGAAGEKGKAAYSAGNREHNYTASGDGGKGGDGGASWADMSACGDVEMLAGENYSQSKAVISRIGTIHNAEPAAQSSQKDENNWIWSKAVLLGPPTIKAYAAQKYMPVTFSSALATPLASRSNTTGMDETLTMNIPAGKVSLLHQFMPGFYLTNGWGGGNVQTEFRYGGNTFTCSTYPDYAFYNMPSGYKFTLPEAAGTHSAAGASNAEGNKYGMGIGKTYLDRAKFNLLPESAVASNPAIKGMKYFFSEDSNEVLYANRIAGAKDTVTLTFDNGGLAKGEYLIKDLQIYYMHRGKKVYVNQTNNDLSKFSDWKTSDNVAMEGYLEPREEKQEKAPLIYKKGELVAYGIFYSDYENDPSRKGYWMYAHTPFNDGEHRDAAIVYDGDGNIISVAGKAVTGGAITLEEALKQAKADGGRTLGASIPRFYVDGKYTVYHWQEDNTSRSDTPKDPDGSPAGYPHYDKASDFAEITFYIQGGASAPWITHISTEPKEVKENEYFKIKAGVDDAEKDVLSLTAEVYKDKELIYTHRQKNITADAAGIYPYVYTDILPDAALGGTYDVVCTVRDLTGAGLGSYKFAVVSLGKITGKVHHTEQWETNRKKYNISWFKNEVNREFSLAEYLALDNPRRRGTNMFWSGERFMLQAAVAGKATSVTCNIKGTAYGVKMSGTGRKNALGETIYAGELWDSGMLGRWGRKVPEQLVFEFTAGYGGSIVKKHEVYIIVDDMNPYWRMHRVF